MLQKLIFISFVFIGSFAGLSCGRSENSETVSVEKSQQIDLKPFRVLVIIGDQWTDPQSYAIDGRRVKSEDFLDVINMLKAWGIPFDILRLDQQRLQINRFLDGAAKPNYGCIIWMADPAILTGFSVNYETLKLAVNEYGISLIGLFDYIKTDQVASLIWSGPVDGAKDIYDWYNEVSDVTRGNIPVPANELLFFINLA